MSVETWRQRLYPDDQHVSPVDHFIRKLETAARPGIDVLDLGAGAGKINRHELRGTARRVVGIDLSPRVLENPLLDEGVVSDITAMPFEPASFDLAFAVYVLEHVFDPMAFCLEVRRVLRPGGTFMALTPNRFHYVSSVARLTPHRFHEWFNRTDTRRHDDEDTFPTFYRLNSRTDIRRCLTRAGFTGISFDMIEVQPNYLMWSTPSFLAGAAYERFVNSANLFAGLRVNIIASAHLP